MDKQTRFNAKGIAHTDEIIFQTINLAIIFSISRLI